jgi:hypothetical protein
MAQANSFSHLGAACVRVLARQAAINTIKSELQRQGLRVDSVPMRTSTSRLTLVWQRTRS